MLMYSTCIFCNQSLGTNEAIEIFPVGRRISFDAAKGRLWVICRKCERWNLSPLEIRWEVIEECETPVPRHAAPGHDRQHWHGQTGRGTGARSPGQADAGRVRGLEVR